MFRHPAAALLAIAVLTSSAAAQAVPTYPGDSITPRARPAHPVYAAPGPIAPSLPGDTLLGNRLSPEAAVPRYPIAPTMPGDVITLPPQWVLDTLHADSVRADSVRADSVRQGLIPDSTAAPGFRVLPDASGRADSLRAAPPPPDPRERRS